MREPDHLRHGRHLDRRGADPRRPCPRSRTRSRSNMRMPIHVPMVDVRTVGAGGGSIARIDRGAACCASGRKAPGPIPARSATGAAARGRPSPMPTCCSAGSTRTRCWRPGGRSAAVRAAFADQIGTPLGLDAERRRGGGAAASPIPMMAGRDPHGVALARRTIRATSRSSPSAARGRCMPSALARELGIPRVLVPARPGITNALGCVVADLRHDFVRTLNRPLDLADIDAVARHRWRRRRPRAARLIAAETDQRSRHPRRIQRDMQFRRPDPSPPRAAARSPRRRRADLQAAFETRLFRPLPASSCRRSAPCWSTSTAR